MPAQAKTPIGLTGTTVTSITGFMGTDSITGLLRKTEHHLRHSILLMTHSEEVLERELEDARIVGVSNLTE